MIKSATQSTIANTQKYRNFNGSYVASSDYKLDEVVLTSSVASVTFDVSPYIGVYKNLQIRATARDTYVYDGGLVLRMTFNGSSSGYAWHQLSGGGSTVTSSAGTSTAYLRGGLYAGDGVTANTFQPSITDILDFASSSKNKTVRSFTGDYRTGIHLLSGLWANTAAITSITITSDVTAFKAGTRFSLYGSN